MRTHRMLRSSLSSEVARSPLPRREDERQGALDLEPHLPQCADARIERLAYENAALRLQLAQADGPFPSETYRAYNPVHGWVDKFDTIAAQAAAFAKRLAYVRAIRTSSEAGQADAAAVNASIAMVAQEADFLITALIEDAEARDLVAMGRWMDIPLIECQEFETPSREEEIEE